MCVELEGLHFCMELWSGSYVDTIVDLEIQEFSALECMVFVANSSRITEPTGP